MSQRGKHYRLRHYIGHLNSNFLSKNYFVLVFFAIITIVSAQPLLAQSEDPFPVKQFVKVRSEEMKIGGESGIHRKFLLMVDKSQIKNFQKTFLIRDELLDLHYTVAFPDSASSENFKSIAGKTDWIEWVEYIPEIEGFYTPNDFQAQFAWHLQKINAQDAWDLHKGDTTITIAIVDDAVAITHEDLLPVRWTNPGEIPANGIDDDGNGYIDDIHGWDAANNDGDPNPPSSATSSFFSHGTHCAGIAAARTDNNLGIASLSFNCRLIAVKTKIDNSSGGTMTATLQGVQYAITAGARVVSMSFGGTSYSQTYQNLFNYGNRLGIVFVAAAGNSNNVIPMYPANYDHVISVGATDPNDYKAGFSSYGANTDIMAPGTAIYSSVVGSGNNQYGNKSGTSMACPLVASLAGLMLSKDPTLTPQEVESCIKSTAVNIDALNPTYAGSLGSGRIDAFQALQCIKPVVADFSSDKKSVCPGGVIQFTDQSRKNPTSWFWQFPGGAPSFSTAQNPQVLYSSNGNYLVRLIVSNQYGSDTIEKTAYVRVGNPTAYLSGNFTVPAGYSVNLRIVFQGEPPFRVKINDGTTQTWVTNIASSPYYHLVSPTQTTSYSLDSVFDSNCKGTATGAALVTIAAYVNPNCNGSAKSFQKHFRANNDEVAHSLIPCREGGYLWVGLTKSVGAGGDDIYVTRLNDTGYVLWSKVIGSSGQEIGYSIKAIETVDSGFAVVGSTKGFGSVNWDILFVKFDRNGTIVKQKRVGGGYEDLGRALIETSDGYVLGGTTGSLPRTGFEDAYLIKLDTGGNVSWTRKRGFPGSTTNHITSIIPLESGNFMAYGAGDAKITPYICVSTKFTNSGTILQECRITTTQFDAIVEVDRMANGNVAAVGNYSTNGGATYIIMALVMDTSSNVLWAQALSGFSEEWGGSVTATSDSGFVVCGFITHPTNGKEMVAIKFSSTGAVLWSRRYGGNVDELMDRWNKNILETSDGGLVFGMNSNSTNTQGFDLMLMKTDPCGFAGDCNEANVSFTINSLSFTTTAFTASANTGGTGYAVSVSEYDWKDSLNTNAQTVCALETVLVPACNYVADFTVQPSCAGSATRLTDNSKDHTGKQQVYSKWIINGTDTVSGLKSINYIFNSAGTFEVTLISGNDGSPSCYDTVSKLVSIYADLNLNILAPDTICQYDSVRLAVPEIFCASGRLTFAWSPGNYFLDSAESNPILSMESSGWIYVRIRDSIGQLAFDSSYIFINEGCCESKARWYSPNPAVCLGDSSHLLNASITKTNASFLWSFDPGSQLTSYIGANPPKLYYPLEGSYSIRLISSDICGTDTFESSIYIIPPPPLFARPDTILCSPDSLWIPGNGGPSSWSYAWEPAMIFNDATSPEPIAWIAQPSMLFVRVNDDWVGCSNTDSFFVDIEQVDTLKKNLDTTFCYPDAVLVDYSNPGVTLLWSDGYDSISRSFSDSITVSVTIERNFCKSIDTLIFRSVDYQASINGPALICEADSGLFFADNPFDSLFWNTGDTTVSLFKSDSGWIGLETYWYGCVSQDSMLVDQFNEHVFISGPRTICENDSIELQITPYGAKLLWSNGDTALKTWYYQEGLIGVRSEYMGCYNYDTIEVKLVRDPVITDFPDHILCIGDTLEVYVEPSHSGVVFWIDGNQDSRRYIMDSGLYIVQISNYCHSAIDTFRVYWEDCTCIPYFPNAFTPNQDNLNDIFKPELCELSDYSMMILSEWGEIMFSTTNKDEGWDGQYRGSPAPEGAYVYLITYKTLNGEERSENGAVMLLRPKK